ncbi:MAG: hypothetical protein AMXMBFR58_09980 [Phycisphaerae bacterium]
MVPGFFGARNPQALSDTKAQLNAAAPQDAAAAADAGASAGSAWRLAWRLPALVVGAAAIVAGAMYAFKTSPLPDFPGVMDVAEGMLERREYEPALGFANSNLYPFLNKGVVGEDETRRYYLLVARAIAGGQREHALNVEANHRNLLGAYDAAVQRGATTTAEDTVNIAEAHLALREYDQAMQYASQLPSTHREHRDRINRRVIQRSLHGSTEERARAVDMIAGMLADPELPAAERIWALGRQAELLIDQGYAGEAIDKLLRAMPRLGAIGEQAGELYVWLARAYMDTQDLGAAAAQLERAAIALDPADPLQAKVDLMAARILESRNDLSEARERYEHVMSQFADTPEELEAMLGLAGVFAQRAEHGEAADVYAALVTRLINGAQHPTVTPAAVAQSLMSRFHERYDAEDDPTAHRYSSMAEDLFGAEMAPDDVIQSQADVNRRLADKAVGPANTAMSRLDLDPATVSQVQRHYRSAAKYYRMMADRTVVTDPAVYQSSLWSAADCFDRSGDRESAIAAFDEFAKAFPDDPKQPEAVFRLAEAYKAVGDLDRASELYRGLIEAQERGDQRSAGPFADASYVPLAQTYLLDNNPDNDAEAQAKLLEVASGRLGGTSTESFREAVIELGNLYFQTGQYEQGIERLREAITRYPEDARVDQMRFRLGECNRMSAAAIEKELTEAMPDARRRELTEARAERLRDAASAYDQVRRDLESKDARRRTALDELMLRNAGFYVADCAFDLGQYDTAIRLYDAAREKFPKDPASLVAMAQIVSAHLKQGDFRRAATANERAKRFYASIPEAAWDDPNLPMSRREWERWLEANSQLDAAGATGTVSDESSGSAAEDAVADGSG